MKYAKADVTMEHNGASLTEISEEINRLQKENSSKEETEVIQKYEAGLYTRWIHQ